MEDKDYIKELFQQKLKNHEVQVNPDLWSAISSNIGTTSSVVSTGLSTSWKWFIGIGSVASITTASVLLLTNAQDEKTPDKATKTEIASPDSATKESNSALISETPASGETSGPQQGNDPQKTRLKKFASDNITDPLHFTSDATDVSALPMPLDENTVDQQTAKNPEEKTPVKETVLAAKDSVENPALAKETQRTALFIGKLPDVFTPNNDNDNDFFFIELKGLSDFSITVLDERNQKVFFSDDPNFRWDGKDLGENPVPEGSYVYFFTGKDSQNNFISKYSTLKVVRVKR